MEVRGCRATPRRRMPAPREDLDLILFHWQVMREMDVINAMLLLQQVDLFELVLHIVHIRPLCPFEN
jgi:hypothetical protein